MLSLFHIEIVPALLWIYFAVLGVYLWSRRCADQPVSGPSLRGDVLIGGFMLLFLFSALTRSIWFYYLEWMPNPDDLGWEVMTETVAGRLCLLTLLLTPLLVWKSRLQELILTGMVIYFPLRCSYVFLKTTGGQSLIGDDHASFLFRLFICEQIAPHNVLYNPYWNGGRVDAAIAASGANMVGNLVLPWLKLFPVEVVYNGLLAGLFIFIVPVCCALAVHLAGGSRRAVLVGFLLGLLPSRMVSKWILHFGTIGANLALPMLAPISACLFTLVYQSRKGWGPWVILVVLSVLYLAWPVGVVMALPLILCLLPGVLTLDRGGWLKLGGAAIVIAVLAWPQFSALIFYANLSSFSGAGSETIHWALEWNRGWRNLLNLVLEVNPVILFAGGLGIWLLPDRTFRRMWGGMMVLLLILAGWGEMWKPQFQLTRAAIPLVYIAIVPAALVVDQYFSSTYLRGRVLAAGVLAMLFYTGINASRIYHNDHLAGAPYRVYPDYMDQFVDILKMEVPEGGRVLFTGATVHAFGGGHVAYLPVLTGREMMAADYYHFSPRMVEYEYPPDPFRKSKEGKAKFFDWYNVTHVVAHRTSWKIYFAGLPETYTLVGRAGLKHPFEVYRVHRDSNMFLQGAGRVTADAKRILIELENPDADAVVKYNYDPRLTASAPAEIFAHDLGDEVRLLGVRPNGASSVTIRLK